MKPFVIFKEFEKKLFEETGLSKYRLFQLRYRPNRGTPHLSKE
jgi:hypothetical protein